MTPTRTTALLSGLFVGIVMPLQEMAANGFALSQQARSLLLLTALALAFFLPVMVFVVGTQHLSLASKDTGTKTYWASLRQVAVRFLFWLLGGGAALAVLSAGF